MISHCGNAWLSDIARREWLAGFGSGLMLGLFFVCLVVAIVGTCVLSEVEQ